MLSVPTLSVPIVMPSSGQLRSPTFTITQAKVPLSHPVSTRAKVGGPLKIYSELNHL